MALFPDLSIGRRGIAASRLAIDASRAKSARAAIAKIDDPLLRKTMTWFLMRDLPAAAQFDEIVAFLDENPDWPGRRRLRARIEEILPENWPTSSIVAWFRQRPPVSDFGEARFARALFQHGRREEGIRRLRAIWIGGNFTKDQERRFYRLNRQHLTGADHRRRLERLLWEGRYWPTRRMFPRVPEDVRKLAEARFLLRHMRGNVDKAIARVPEELRRHEGLIYERLRWRRRKGRDDSARALLSAPIPGLARPDLWARERIHLARRALAEGLITEAYDLVRQHGLTVDETALYADAEWLAGWIALRFLGEPQWAYDHFRALYTAVRFPISRARGAYWSGRAAEAVGEPTSASIWFAVAASYAETYYGQLALARMSPGKALSIAEDPPRDQTLVDRLQRHELARAAEALVGAGARDRVRPLIDGLAAVDAESAAWQAVAAIFARHLGRPDIAIRIAKRTARNGELILDSAFPTLAALGLSNDSGRRSVEDALVHGIIRQESAFYPKARSRAGALGLMQVMPATARQVAKANGFKYDRRKLQNDPDYNRTFGAAYLAKLLDNFGGSYVLALAAYNAGPSRAKRWINEFGDPRLPDVDAVDWIEMIPFDETRNYVQRVLEGVQVYRAILSDDDVQLAIADDLKR